MAAQSALGHPLRQLRPRASAWGREKRNSLLNPGTEGKGGQRLEILGWVCSGDSMLPQEGMELGHKGLGDRDP